ncbi:MAG: cation diffusion facilitator family transporter [Bacilli bacterium]|nr:cation diffusion facilitator family transporter [Bacilli bacterium]
MTELLLRIFVKNYIDTNNEKVRASYGLLGAGFGVITNLILFVSKIVIGLLIANLSIIADALNNLSDFGSCFLSIFGFKMSSKPADAEHPYGHQRMEYIVSLIISVIIIALGGNIAYQAILRLISPEAPLSEFPLIPIIILGISILLKVLQGYVYFSLGKRIDSLALKASGADARNDVLTTTGVLAGLLISYYTGFTRADGILAIVVSLFILYTGIKILLQTGDVLLGEKPSKERIDAFMNLIKSNPQVLGSHDLEMHCYGPNAVFASIHVEVDGSIDVFKSHDMIDNLESECFKKLGIKTVIHMDPIKVNDPQTDYTHNVVMQAIKKINPELSIHDFRIVSGPTHTNAVFDMVIPFSAKADIKNLMRSLREEVKKIDPNINIVVNCDDEYTMLSNKND